MVIIVGITGAFGVIYGIRLLEVLATNKEVETKEKLKIQSKSL